MPVSKQCARYYWSFVIARPMFGFETGSACSLLTASWFLWTGKQVVLQLAQEVFMAAKVLLFAAGELPAAVAAAAAGAAARKRRRVVNFCWVSFFWLWRLSCQWIRLRLPVQRLCCTVTVGCVSMGWQGCGRVVFWCGILSDPNLCFWLSVSSACVSFFCFFVLYYLFVLLCFLDSFIKLHFKCGWCWGSARHYKIWLYLFVTICRVATLAWNLGRLSNTILWVNLVVSSKSLELISWKRYKHWGW